MFNRHEPPARYCAKYYKTNPDDSGPPLYTLGVVDMLDHGHEPHEWRALELTRGIANGQYAGADSWELVERTGIYWDAFDDECGSWEWSDKTIHDSWQETSIKDLDGGASIEYAAVQAHADEPFDARAGERRKWVPAKIARKLKTRVYLVGYHRPFTAREVALYMRRA